MIDATHTNDSDELQHCIDAVRRLDDAAVDAAANRLRAHLPPLDHPPRRRAAAWRLAGAALAVATILAIGPWLLPGNGGDAFAQVQQWFATFRTAHVVTTMKQGDNVILAMEIWTDDAGNTRIDMDEVTHIVEPSRGTMHTLLPGRQIMTVQFTPDSDAAEATDWMAELRDFQGQAELLAETRMVAGIAAAGYRLEVDGSRFTLWADPVTNRPLLVEATLPGGVTMDHRLAFDEPLPLDVFTVPSGYQPIRPD